MDEGHDKIYERITELTAGIYENTSSVRELSTRIGALSDKVEDSIKELKAGQRSQGERIGALEAKPAKRWEAVVGQIIGLVVAAVVGGMVSQVMN